MAIAKVQHKQSHNSLAQTFNTVLDSAPTEGNLLVALLGHDENTVDDVADITNPGWVRMATFESPDLFGAGVDGRVSAWARIAEAGETATVAWDLGEVNRRAHGWVVEFSGFVGTLPDENLAIFQGDADVASGTSSQVDGALEVPAGVVGLMFTLLVNTFTAGSMTFDAILAKIGDASANLRGSGVAWVEGIGSDTESLQPTANWTTSRSSTSIFVSLSETPPLPPAPTRWTREVEPGHSVCVNEFLVVMAQGVIVTVGGDDVTVEA